MCFSWSLEISNIPLPKNNKVSFRGINSTPISTLPVLSKIMEKLIFAQILYYFTNFNLSSDFQLCQMDAKLYVSTVFLDFSAAFDVIDHNLQLDKLSAYGFTDCAVRWMNSYLTNRSQSVYFNGSFSSALGLDCRVPQGSCLGPLCFSILQMIFLLS